MWLSFLRFEPLNTKRPFYMALERQVMSWDRHKHVLGLNQLRGPHPSPSDNFITNKIRYSRTCLKTALYSKLLSIKNSLIVPINVYNFNLYIKGNCWERPHFQVPLSGLYIQVWLYMYCQLLPFNCSFSNFKVHVLIVIFQEYLVGKLASNYIGAYHSLHHFKYNLYKRCLAKVCCHHYKLCIWVIDTCFVYTG